MCQFGERTQAALAEYIALRSHQKPADSPALWTGANGPMGGWGIAYVVTERGRQAGIDPIHPHMFRHTFAHRWLAAGGSEGDLMKLAGWKSRSMLEKYGAAAACARARAAHQQLAIGDTY